MANLFEIEALTKRFADARAILNDRVSDLEAAIAAIKRKRITGIRTAANAASDARGRLSAAIQESAEHFTRPRSRVFHGVKVGLQKGKGKIQIADRGKTVQLIKKHLPDQADALIKVTESPIKSALENLPADQLKKIGVTVRQTGDEVVIKPTDSEIDKLVDAYLKGTETEDEQTEKAA